MGAIRDKHLQAKANMPKPDVDGLMDAIDVELGRTVTRQLLREYPDFLTALQRGRFARAWLTFEDAMNDGAIDQDLAQTIAGLAAQHGIETPKVG